MGSPTRTLAIVAALAAVGLAGFAGWTATRSASTATRTPDDVPSVASRPAAALPPAPRPPPLRAPGRTAPTPAAKTDSNADTDTDTDTDTDAAPPPRDAFDFSRERFDSAAQMLKHGELDAINTRALMQQARLAIKDMEALLDATHATHRRDLTRATEALAQLEARYGE